MRRAGLQQERAAVTADYSPHEARLADARAVVGYARSRLDASYDNLQGAGLGFRDHVLEEQEERGVDLVQVAARDCRASSQSFSRIQSLAARHDRSAALARLIAWGGGQSALKRWRPDDPYVCSGSKQPRPDLHVQSVGEPGSRARSQRGTGERTSGTLRRVIAWPPGDRARGRRTG